MSALAGSTREADTISRHQEASAPGGSAGIRYANENAAAARHAQPAAALRTRQPPPIPLPPQFESTHETGYVSQTLDSGVCVNNRRTAFFVSDRTGITAEMLGHSLLTQFEGVRFQEVTLPFVDSVSKAQDVVRQINERARTDRVRPLVISTLVNTDIARVVSNANALFLDCFEIFISPLEKELGVLASHAIGRSHSANDFVNYHHRIESLNYTLSHDDGVSPRDLGESDIILVGVSRCGKTPTCLYLAMQYGIRAANYPLVPEDFSAGQLPSQLRTLAGRLYGLTIRPERLQQIRSERRPGSTYATLSNCEFEVRRAEDLMRHEGIPILDVTSKSVEELATTILHEAKLVRRVY